MLKKKFFFFIKFSPIVHKKLLNIPDDKEEDFDDNIYFYLRRFLLVGTTIYEILKIRF